MNRGDGVEYELVGEDGEVVIRSNRSIIDDPSRQKLSMEAIEVLKKEGTGAGRDLIAKLLASHSALKQKTTFSLAKYTLRKTKKYLRRFTVLALDIPTLTNYLMTDKEPMKVMELREELLALIGSWANVHYTPEMDHARDEENRSIGGGRWLVIDETGGLVVAAMAERMGILSPNEEAPALSTHGRSVDEPLLLAGSNSHKNSSAPRAPTVAGMSARTNTLTVLHSNAQPNLALLRYFSFDISNPTPCHPLFTRLKALSWLQLLHPEDDSSTLEPPLLPSEVLSSMKSGKRGTYHRQRRRWERIQSVLAETRAGGFDGLVLASVMEPVGVLKHLIPLLRGGAQVVIYSPYVQPLVELADLYSVPRRTAYKAAQAEESIDEHDFPLDPMLLLAPTLQTAKVRQYQCLPGRTHPVMTARGGAEGYLFTATRVLPAGGPVEARGKFKKRKQSVRGEEQGGPDRQALSAPETTVAIEVCTGADPITDKPQQVDQSNGA